MTRTGIYILIIILFAALVSACSSPGEKPTAVPAAVVEAPSLQPSPTLVPPTPTQAPPTSTVAPPAPTAVPATPVPTGTSGVAATGEDDPAGPVEAPVATVAPTPLPSPVVERHESGKRVIALDPGHGGPESGAWAYGLAEKDVNLDIALKLADLLRAEGYEAVLTRDTDRATSPLYTGGGYAGGLRYDIQARVDTANAAGADLFISIHNNGGDPGQSGTEVWYNLGRPFSDRNVALAELVQENLLARIRALGYPAVDRGIKDDTNFRIFRGRPYNLYVLGPGTGARPHEPTHMPGVLGESLFISHAGDAAMLAQERTLDAIAAGYRDAVVAYFDRFPD